MNNKGGLVLSALLPKTSVFALFPTIAVSHLMSRVSYVTWDGGTKPTRATLTWPGVVFPSGLLKAHFPTFLSRSSRLICVLVLTIQGAEILAYSDQLK